MNKSFTTRIALLATLITLACVSTNAQSNSSLRARYRVTLIGFTAHNQTWDHAFEVDGKGDEVYIVHDVRVFNRHGGVIQAPATVRSQVMGDINNQYGRVQAGSLSDKGGIRSNDSFPSNTPWVRRGGINADRIPLLLWEGDLVADETTAVIIPTIWEWDGGEDMFTGWKRTIAANGAAIGGAAATLVSGPAAGAGVATALQLALPAASRFLGDVVGNASDRPIGAERAGEGWTFAPQAITLTYEIAENTIANNSGRGRGIIPVHYKDSSDLRGDYTLYVQVERISIPAGPFAPLIKRGR